jgi:large subunit ribosomal protein L20
LLKEQEEKNNEASQRLVDVKRLTVAKNAVEKAMCYAYRDRKVNKRNFRALWIQRINAGARLGMSYSQFMGKVRLNKNRKVLADLAMNHPEAFKAILNKVK